MNALIDCGSGMPFLTFSSISIIGAEFSNLSTTYKKENKNKGINYLTKEKVNLRTRRRFPNKFKSKQLPR